MLAAQSTTYISPKGYDLAAGTTNKAEPFGGQSSGTYQQVHDDLATVFPSSFVVVKALSFRKSGTATVAARTLDAQVTLGVTPLRAQTASTTFAANLGASPSVVLAYTNLSLPALSVSATPNPQGWFFPFTAPFPYFVTNGNLCYELRFKNVTPTGTAAMDAVSGNSYSASSNIGTGCIATGQTTAAATSGGLSLSGTSTSWTPKLVRGAANAPAAMFIGDTAQHIVVPGFCSALEFMPIVTVNGGTDSAGAFGITLTYVGSMTWVPGFSLYAQSAFLDAGLPNGLGISNACRFLFRTSLVARIYTLGSDTATTGTRDTGPSGLVTGFDI